MTAPTGVRNYSNTAAQATLSAAIGATDTSIALSTATGDPSAPFTAALARGTASEEIVLVTALVGSTATVVRGYDNTTAKAQPAGTTFQEVVVALDFREANNHVNATGSVHGLTSGLVGVSDTQTLTNKTVTLVAGTVAGTPAAAADLVRKDYADGLGVSAPTAATIARRDAVGRLQVADPAVAADAATKGYTDGKVAGLPARIQSGLVTFNVTAGSTGLTVNVVFPTAFAALTAVVIGLADSANDYHWSVLAQSATATGFTARLSANPNFSAPVTANVVGAWIAIGA